jgi:hypothetical protein
MRREVCRNSNKVAWEHGSMGTEGALSSVGEDTTAIRETIPRGAVQL